MRRDVQLGNTPFAYCPSMMFLPVQPHCTNARWNRCQEALNGFPLENLRWPPTCLHTMWMKTIQQDRKSNYFSLNEAIDVAQNHPLWRLMSTLVYDRTDDMQVGVHASKVKAPWVWNTSLTLKLPICETDTTVLIWEKQAVKNYLLNFLVNISVSTI